MEHTSKDHTRQVALMALIAAVIGSASIVVFVDKLRDIVIFHQSNCESVASEPR
jgi:hypothetical protein